MPNMKKITAPRNTTIKGQPHQLAYINDAEQGLLMALGGSGRTVNGVPAYDDVDESYGIDAADVGSFDSGGGYYEEDTNDSSSYGGVSDDERTAAIAKATGALQQSILNTGALQSNMTPQDFAFDTGPSNADRVAQSYFDYADVFGPEIYSSNYIGGSIPDAIKNRSLSSLVGVPSYSSWMDHIPTRTAFSNMAIDRLNNRIEGYKNDDSFLGRALSGLNTRAANNIIKGLKDGGRPVLDSKGRVMGVFEEGPFGFGEVYTGRPVEGVVGTGFDNLQFGGTEDVKPPNPLTGQCPEGYVFDDDLNACRVDTGSGDGEKDAIAAPDGLMYRRGLLDDAPAFMPEGMDFDEMNTAFRRTAAYNPDNFENQMDTTGFTILK